MVKFDDSLNREIARTVKNFNAKQRYNKTKTKGKGMLPERISGKVLKAKYSDKPKAELMKQLKLYQSFAKRGALKKSGVNTRLSIWEEEYFKANLEKTKQFYDDEIADLERIIGDVPQYHLRLHPRLETLKNQRKELDKDLSTLSEDQIKGFRGYFDYAERSNMIKEKGFRLYLSQLERTMAALGYSKQDINILINKFNQLSENEFTEMVRNEDIIDSIYDIIDSPKGRGNYELMVDETNARHRIESIIETADELILTYKTNK